MQFHDGRYESESLPQDFERSVRTVVRRVIRRGCGSSPFARQVLDAAREITRDVPAESRAERERLIAEVSRRISASIRADARGETTREVRYADATLPFSRL